jgi:hypothetical protein
MMWRVTDANSSDGFTNAQQDEQGVLANLPRTRPQRTTERRAAARNSARSSDAADATPIQNGGSTTSKQASGSGAARAGANSRAPTRRESAKQSERRAERPRSSARAGASARRQASAPKRRTSDPDPAPRQGFECDGDAASGAVHPPGAAELVASAAEIVGELAKAGLSTGERLIKDVVSRLPLS